MLDSAPTRYRRPIRWMLPVLLVVPAVLALGAAGTSATPPPMGLPACVVADRAALLAAYDEWDTTILDPAITLGPGYVPPDLDRQLVGGRPITLRAFVFPPLRDMLAAAIEDGAAFWVTSAYRSFEGQQRIVDANPGVEDEVARAGHSEHQLGTTIDLAGADDWLAANAFRFGFVLSYSPERSPTWTCYRAEPWHFRYFGIERAAAIERSGLSPREWLWANEVLGSSS